MGCPHSFLGGHKGEAKEGAGQGQRKRLRVYEAWEGNEKFFCWGFFITGPNWKPAIGTVFILIAPVVIYLVFVASYMTFQRSAAIMVFSCILPVLALLFLFMTACSDPGIIPRRQPDEEYLQGRKPRTKEVIVNNHRIITRYNDTCHLYQPPRAHHCSVNDNCIERFDHHCPWVGTTVGKRNYRPFLLFIYTATVLCLYAFGNSLASLFVRHRELVDEAQARGESGDDKWGDAIGDTIPSIVIMAYTFLLFWFVGGLSGFHAYLVSTNQTTYETFRYRHEDRPNPYDRGIVANCAEVWCTPIEPSKVKFRAFVDEVGEPDADVETGGPETTAAGSGTDARQQQQQQQHQHHHPIVAPQPAPSFQERAQESGNAHYYSVGLTPLQHHYQQQLQQQQQQRQQQHQLHQALLRQHIANKQQELYSSHIHSPLPPYHPRLKGDKMGGSLRSQVSDDGAQFDSDHQQGKEHGSVDSKDVEVEGMAGQVVAQSGGDLMHGWRGERSHSEFQLPGLHMSRHGNVFGAHDVHMPMRGEVSQPVSSQGEEHGHEGGQLKNDSETPEFHNSGSTGSDS